VKKKKSSFKPLSLAQHFEAPDEFVGEFGWVCGYSADIGFLDDALERFVRLSHNQRGHEGRISIGLMLDAGCRQITPIEVPGVLHLPIVGVPPFRLLHAKVGLLGFRHLSDSNQWRLRLIVSTGNWTRATLEDNLDLAWCVELETNDLKNRNDAVKQTCADMRAAWEMLDWLRSKCDVRGLQTSRSDRQDSETQRTGARLESWIAEVSRIGKRTKPQFFDNRNASLLDALPAMIQRHASSTTRNYLAMASGFYESSSRPDEIPSVLNRIVKKLNAKSLLTNDPIIDVFVNPHGCQAVAASADAIQEARWNVREAAKHAFFGNSARSLHGKFMFGANLRDNSELCNSPWVYLGSGNLTGPGFANKMSSGNLEVGVVFDPGKLYWNEGKGIAESSVLTNVLPIQWETNIEESSTPLAAGDDMPELELAFCAAPVAILFWRREGESRWLDCGENSGETVTEPFDVLDDCDEPCQRDPEENIFRWNGERPRQVQVQWQTDQQKQCVWVPVVDEFGRVAATILPQLGIDEAWSQLNHFPMPPPDEELAGDELEGAGYFDDTQASIHKVSKASYPVREMMQLVENIAAKQTAVEQIDWNAWCTRFEQCLTQAADNRVLEEFRQLELNPLSPLRHAAFRPDYAINSDTIEGRRYEESLTRVEIAWNVNELCSMDSET
jgi:hypothetical protein